jgi:hypothetical protein
VRRIVGTAAGALGVLVGVPALAKDPGPPPRVSLRWTAPDGCPGPERVLGEVDRLLGDAGARPKESLRVVADVSKDANGNLRVHLEAEGESGPRVRELRAASCEALADAAALILALMIDPSAALAAPTSAASTPPPAPAPPTPPPSPPPPPPVPPANPRTTPKVSLGVWGVFEGGSLPGAGFGVAGTVAVTLAALRIEVGVGGLPLRDALVSAPKGAGGHVSLVTGDALLCYDVLPRSAFELSPCAGYEGGWLHAAGFGVKSPGSGSDFWSAVRAGGLFTWSPVPRFALSLRGEAVVPFVRPTFVLENVGPVYRPGPVSGRLALGAEARF